MSNVINFALNLINSHPSIANNPQAREFINVIQNGDSARGAQIAENLCKTYGDSKEDALIKARQFFNLR